MASQRTRFLTTQKLGEKQSLTPEGFLVIEDVPVARVGVQEYHTTEVGLPGDANGIVKVHRTEEEVFKPAHVLSYNGKAIVNDHPDPEKYPDGVTPENYKVLTVGSVQNPHRGTGLQADLLFADFVVMDAGAIADVRSGKREVSCGYDADYNEIEPGVGEQVNLIGNHIALVEAGRCGARCSIGDRKTKIPTGDDAMRIRTHDKQPAWLDRLMKAKDKLIAAMKAKDEAAVKEAEKEVKDAETAANTAMEAGGAAEGDHTHLHIHQDGDPAGGGAGINGAGPTKMTDEEISGGFKEVRDSMKKFGDTLDAIAKHVGYDASGDAEATKEIEGQLEEEAPAGTGDRARKARDSVYLGDAHQSAAAIAEILVPGVRIPTYDKAADPKRTFKDVCELRRSTLELLNNTGAGRAMIELVHGKKLVLDGMKCGDARVLFNAVGALKKQQNRTGTQATGSVQQATNDAGAIRKRVTVADIQRINEEARDKRLGKKAA